MCKVMQLGDGENAGLCVPKLGLCLRANAEDRSLAFGPGLHGCSHLMAVQTSEFT